jgi:hypothetical protein
VSIARGVNVLLTLCARHMRIISEFNAVDFIPVKSCDEQHVLSCGPQTP